MDFEQLFRIVGPAIVPILTAVIAYLKERTERKRTPTIIKRETAHVAFWRSYYEALILVESEPSLETIRRDMQMQLSIAADHVREAQERELNQAACLIRPTSFFRQAILAYKPPIRWLWILRMFFYYYLAVLLLAPVTSLTFLIKLYNIATILKIYTSVMFVLYILWLVIRYLENAAIRYKTRTRHQSSFS